MASEMTFGLIGAMIISKSIEIKACSNGPNNVGPTLFNKLETLGSTACFSSDNPIRFIPVETWCVKVFAKKQHKTLLES